MDREIDGENQRIKRQKDTERLIAECTGTKSCDGALLSVTQNLPIYLSKHSPNGTEF